MAEAVPLLELRGVETRVGGRRSWLGARRASIQAVADMSFSVVAGETFAVVGESGSGKSTLGRTILGLQRETAGTIRLDGRVVSGLEARAARKARPDVQYLHQDAAAALDPWWSVGRSLEEALIIGGVGGRAARRARVGEMLALVGLAPALGRRYPHELSGGQLRRVTLARVLLLGPRLLVLDEPTAGLDLSVQATVLRLLRDLGRRLGLTYVLISHDLSVVRQVSDRVAIMYLGRLVELAPTARLFEEPCHPYTRALLAAMPRLEPGRVVATAGGEAPGVAAAPTGCAFRLRCPHAAPGCAEAVPALEPVGPGESVACFRWEEVRAARADGTVRPDGPP